MSMFAVLGRLGAGHPRSICAGWLVAALLLTLLVPSFDPDPLALDTTFLPDRCDSVRGQRLLHQSFPSRTAGRALVVALERPGGLTSADEDMVRLLRDDLAEIGDVSSSIHADPELALVRVTLPADVSAVTRVEVAARDRLAMAGAEAPQLSLAGPAAAVRNHARHSLRSRFVIPTALAIVLVGALLALLRRPLPALAGAGVAAAATLIGVKLAALTIRLSGDSPGDYAQPTVSVILFATAAVAVWFLLRRLRDELTAGHEYSTALARTSAALSGRIAAAVAVFACGWLLLGFAEFDRLRALGFAVVAGLVAVALCCLIVLPAVMTLLGPWRSGASRRDGTTVVAVRSSRWRSIRESLSRLTTGHSAVMGTVLLVLLTPVALVGLLARVSDRPESHLSPRAAASRGLAVLKRHGVAGEAGPLQLLLTSSNDWSVPAGRELLDHLTDSLGRLPNVAAVRGAVDDSAFQAHLGTDNAWMPGRSLHVARLEVVFASAPGDAESVAALETIQTWLRERLTASVGAECAGVTVTARDLGRIAAADSTRHSWLLLAILLTIVAVLVARLESIVHLGLAVVVSYPVALGFAALAGPLLGGGAVGEIDWATDALLFPILVAGGTGLSLLPTRRHGDHRGEPEDRLRRGLTWTARRTAGAGLLLSGLWAVLLLDGRGVPARLGAAVAVGLLVDALVVRRVLVPALAGYLARQRKQLRDGWEALRDVKPRRRAG